MAEWLYIHLQTLKKLDCDTVFAQWLWAVSVCRVFSFQLQWLKIMGKFWSAVGSSD